MHEEEILYKDLGAGGVDLPAIWDVMQRRNYTYWVTLDLDPPRQPGVRGIAEALRFQSREPHHTMPRFLSDTKLPPPPMIR